MTIYQNNIYNFATAGLQVDDAPVGADDYATCNWWGNDSGPTNALNPGGSGDVVSGSLVLENFSPWLIAPAPEGTCGSEPLVPPKITKSFNPSIIYFNEKTLLTLTLSNPNSTNASIVAPLIDTFPHGMKVWGAASTTCGGTLTAIKHSNSITLTGGVIPAHGACTVSVQIKAAANIYLNILPAGVLQTDLGNNTNVSAAFLIVKPHI